MAKWVILAGGFGLPDRTASATRARGIAKLLRHAGFKPLILGKFPTVPSAHEDGCSMDIDGIPACDIRKPWPDAALCNYTRNASSIEHTLSHLGSKNVSAVILYNYPSAGLISAKKACEFHRIPLGLDITEWYGWEGKKIARNILRIVDSEYRMRWLAGRVGNVICTSSWLKMKLAARNMFVLPFVVDPKEEKWARRRNLPLQFDGPRRFVYSGSPGVGLHKDSLSEIVSGFALVDRASREYRLDVFGISRGQFLSVRPQQASDLRKLGDRICFHGRVEHEKALDELASAHFAIFLRKPSRANQSGFPTKYMEAATLGVPVVANLTSDLGRFLADGVNGIVVREHSAEAMHLALRSAIDMNGTSYAKMRQNQSADNPFAVCKWVGLAEQFMRRMRQ